MSRPVHLELSGVHLLLRPLSNAKARALVARLREAAAKREHVRHARLVVDAVFDSARKLTPKCTRQSIADAIDLGNVMVAVAAVVGTPDLGVAWQNEFTSKLTHRIENLESNHG